MTAQHDDTPLPTRLAEAIGHDERLDGVVERLAQVADRITSNATVRGVLEGGWLGHPLHPALTDLPVGFWTSASVLDLAGTRTSRAADLMVAAGLLSALPTAAAGLADWRRRDEAADRRVGAAHAVANTAATVLYALSLGHRLRGHRVRGVALGMAGAAAATAAGHLGGHLAFGADDADRATAAEEAGVVDQQGAALAQLDPAYASA